MITLGLGLGINKGGLPPTPPSTPVANATSLITNTTFTLNWSVAAGATSYIIDLSTDITFTSGMIITNLNVGNVLLYNVTGLTQNTTYYFRVRAFNLVPSVYSNTITTLTFTTYVQTFETNVTTNGGSLTTLQKANYNSLFIELMAAGASGTDLDVLYNFAGYTQIQSNTSLFGNFLAIPMNTPTWTTKVGYTMNGTSYIKSGFINSTNGVKFKLNDASILWKRMGTTPSAYLLCAALGAIADPSDFCGWRGNAADFFYDGINQSSSNNNTNGALMSATSYTKLQVKRTSSTVRSLVYDGNVYTPVAQVSSSLMTVEGYICARNNNNSSADFIAESGTGTSYYGKGSSSVSQTVIDTAITNFIARM